MLLGALVTERIALFREDVAAISSGTVQFVTDAAMVSLEWTALLVSLPISEEHFVALFILNFGNLNILHILIANA